MTASTLMHTTTFYTHRRAIPEDADAIAPLMASFAQERLAVDPSMVVKPAFNFERYIAYQLTKPLS